MKGKQSGRDSNQESSQQNDEELVEELKKVRGVIPFSLNRRDFIAGLGVAAVSAVGAAALSGCSAKTTASASTSSSTGSSTSAGSSSTTGMSFSNNEGKTMGEVLGAGWLGEEPEIADSEISETLTTKIVVCGAGHAGTACARKAAELGADVVLIESQAEDSFILNGQDIGHLNSKWQTTDIGIPKYDPSDFINDYQTYSAARAQWTLVSQFANRSGEAFDWLIDSLTTEERSQIIPLNWPVVDGYEYKRGTFGSYVGTAHFEKTDTITLDQVVARNRDAAVKAGAEIRWGTKVVRLLHNDEDTEVTGIIAQDADGNYIKINADAVVLACGDIGSNSPMYNAICAENYALGEYKDQSAFSGRDGSGIAVAMRMGAKVEVGTGGNMGTHSNQMMSVLEMAQTIWLNRYGKRFCDEAYGGPMLSGVAVAREPGSVFYSVWDADWQNLLLNQCAGHQALKYWDDATIAAIKQNIEAAVGSGSEGYVTTKTTEENSGGGYLYCADTLEELFTYLGMESGAAKNAAASIEAWNEMCDAGYDGVFGRAANTMFPIKKAPYYGAVFSKSVGGNAMSLCTTSGLLVTGDQQVQGQGYEPIKGLYASGNNSGGRFPFGYNGIMNGVSVGMSMTLGYTLGEFLATADLDEATTLGLNDKAPKTSSKS